MITNELISEIKSKINDNHKQAITGGVLQGVLVDMVKSLCEVYPQTYTEEEKAQARTNIDALSNYDGEITKEKLSIEVQAILDNVANKQNITDESLTTIAKTIVGAINELFNGGVKDKSIAASKIEDGAITEDKLALHSVTNAKIANASVSEEKITDSSVSTEKLKDGAITEPKLDTALVNIITSAVQPAELASAIATALTSYVAKEDIVDTTGSATDKVMSQKAVTDNLALKANSSNVYTKAQADAITKALADSLSRIFRDLGIYPELEPVPLNPEVTGKHINADGKYVDASDWNVASIGAVSLGNTYLLNMVSSANMVLGVALFVSRVYKRDKEGKIIGTMLTPLFSAKNTSIPASGYVLFEAMDDYDEVLICYKPALTTQMLVARWGFKASHATQLRNLRLIVDNKTDFEGIYELLTAGYALNLVGKGNGEPQAFLSRKTGGGNITDGSAVIKEVDGVQPIVWNQLISIDKFFTNQATASLNNGIWSVAKRDGFERACLAYLMRIDIDKNGYKLNHIYLVGGMVKNTSDNGRICLKYNSSPTSISGTGNASTAILNAWVQLWEVIKFTTETGNEHLQINGDGSVGVALTYQVKDAFVLDLTQMFGAGNEPTTYEEYLDRISHYHIKDAYAYNAGEVVNYKGVGIKTTNVDGTKTYVRDWSEVMKKYFPDGMTSLNGVKDFFNERKAVRKWGCKVFDGTENWQYYSVSGKIKTPYFSIINVYPDNSTGNELFSSHYLYKQNFIFTEDMDYKIMFTVINKGFYISDSDYTSVDAWKAHLAELYAQGNPLVVYYELSEPVEDIFEKPLNLTYTVINGGTETSLATENSTQFEGSIAYNKDYVAVVDELQLQNRVTTIEFENWEN